MYDVGLGDCRLGFTIGVAVTKEEKEFFRRLGVEYGIDNFLGLMLLDKNIYKWDGEEKYVEFCFRVQWYMDFAIDKDKEGTNANRFYEFCCNKKETRGGSNGGPIFVMSRVFSIENWQKEIENLVGLAIC